MECQDDFSHTCNNCSVHVETRYHCTICRDFDLCVSCFDKDGHYHQMEKLGFGLGDNSATCDKKQANLQEASRLASINRCVQSLLHESQCKNRNCKLTSCQKMKKISRHSKVCKLKTIGACPVCKQLLAICNYHSEICQEVKCRVLYCMIIKHKRRQKDLQQAQILDCRIAALQITEMHDDAVNQPNLGNSSFTNQPSPGTQSHTSLYPPQPGIYMRSPCCGCWKIAP